MPKTNRPRLPPEACAFVPIESPVPGVNIELASLLVQAIKARRKFLSKSSSSAEVDDVEKETLRQGVLQDLQNTADDKTAACLNELRRQVERSSASASKPSSSQYTTKPSSKAPTNCLEFLLEIISDGSNNSVHLRRSALSLARGILERSSDCRAFLASGRRLLDFVSVIEGVEHDQVEEEHNEAAINSSDNTMSPNSIFQLEAMELIHLLASKFGRFYTQFTVASRLLGDVSVNFSMHNTIHTSNNNDLQEGGRRHSQRVNMKILRRERDIALEFGPKACQNLGRMVERADVYFRVLVPRFGGFNAEEYENQVIEERSSEIDATSDSKQADNDTNVVDHDEEDDDSIDWEEGDFGLSDSDNFNEDTHDASSDLDNDKPNDHQAAVEQTMDIMGRGGALLEGKLAVQFGGKSMDAAEATPIRANTDTPADADYAAAPTSQPADAHTEARRKIQTMVQKFSTPRLPRLNRWIHALSHADGMQERVVIDPATAAIPGNEGPTSLVLLSEEKRAMRGQVLQRMMKVRGEMEGALRSAAKLGIRPEGDGKKKVGDGSTGGALENEVGEAPVKESGHENMAGIKRSWMPAHENLAVVSKKKKSKTSRFKVIYRKK